MSSPQASSSQISGPTSQPASATSLVYRSSWIYEFLMILLYGPHYAHRYQALAALIPPGSTVTDVCCGPAILYHRYLKQRYVNYTGVDVNADFIHQLNQNGAARRSRSQSNDQQANSRQVNSQQSSARGILMDVQGATPLPVADYVIMQASLYHFLPDGVDAMMDKLLVAARRQVIIAEPVKNLSDSNIPLLSLLARRSANPGTGHQANRFNETTLDQAMARFVQAGQVIHTEWVANGREKIFVIQKAE